MDINSTVDKQIHKLQALVKNHPKSGANLLLWANETLQVVSQIYGLLWHQKYFDLLNSKAEGQWAKKIKTRK